MSVHAPDPALLELLDCLMDEDRAWLELMADVLPDSLPVAGTLRWRDATWASWMTTERVRG